MPEGSIARGHARGGAVDEFGGRAISAHAHQGPQPPFAMQGVCPRRDLIEIARHFDGKPILAKQGYEAVDAFFVGFRPAFGLTETTTRSQLAGKMSAEDCMEGTRLFFSCSDTRAR